MSSPLVETLGLIASSSVLSSGITLIASMRSKKTDINQKTIEFWEKKAETYLDKMTELDERVTDLEKLKCKNKDCENRL